MPLATAAPARYHADTAQRNARVSLVDNTLRTILTLVLKQNDFEVEVASNVDDALKLIAAETFDVLLSDRRTPAPAHLRNAFGLFASTEDHAETNWRTLPH